ncbi:carboxymuconolactone decarboxylase family protein [Halobacillus amylolyticus]|uniref:Carboxymuconolactone decarboxylase family protein n=1 Tax=Halobacillus amylolyticus TaxID=2932259 RepID=A0ABY4HAS7_9BACI|nr:carboxymuconolactone decarboxylase family protein [Halobacillus amylolyticus]UOR11804.1 carboxymuconolactone decarboxylase family protein [Halobacillus amylolyticus]
MEQEVNWTTAFLQEYKHGIGIFADKMPEVAHHFNEFSESCFKEGELSKKQKQLMALGISIVAQDEYCMVYHTKGCVDQGASEQEVMEACGVAAAFGGGAALSQAVTLVQDAYTDLSKTKH